MSKKFLSMMLACLMLFVSWVIICADEEVAPNETQQVSLNDGGMSINNIGISTTSTTLLLNGNGSVTCGASTNCWAGYTAGVVMELQQYKNGNWQTIKTWSNLTASIHAVLEQIWFIESGYSYQVKSTHSCYYAGYGGGQLVESFVKYSRTVTY